MGNDNIPDYEDKVELAFPNAKQVKVSDVLGDNLVFKDYVTRDGDSGQYFIILVSKDGADLSFACGSKTIMKQIEQLKNDGKLPRRALFKKVKNKEKTFSYYTLTAPEVEEAKA